MASRVRSALVPVLCLSACVALGVVLGRAWPAAAGWWPERHGAAREALPSFADAVAAARPGVVTIRARLPAMQQMAAAHAAGERGDPQAAADAAGFRYGSGFVVHERGLVLTSRHVLAGTLATEVIGHDGEAFAAELVGEDLANDLALLRLVAAPRDLVALPLGDSAALRAGDWIVAVGNPFGLAQTVTAGVVSFVGRHLRHSDFGVTSDYLQFSAPVNPGNSGGPVLDLHGRVVGLATQGAAAAQGISFAVPSHTLKRSLAAMAAAPDGRVRRGYLGIEFQSQQATAADGRTYRGAVVTRVAEGDPAHRAGLRRGDLIVSLDGTPVEDATALHERIAQVRPGARVQLQLCRHGGVLAAVEAVLGEVGPTLGTPN